jgi:hypothetical protein
MSDKDPGLACTHGYYPPTQCVDCAAANGDYWAVECQGWRDTADKLLAALRWLAKGEGTPVDVAALLEDIGDTDD